MITHKFTDEDTRLEPVEPTVYPATIKGAEEGISKSGGNEQIALVWELENKHIIFDYLTFTSKTGYKIDSFLKSIGMAPAKGTEIEIDARELIGKRAFIDVVIEEDNYGKKNKVAKYVCNRDIPEPLETVDTQLPTGDEAKKPVEDTDNLPF